MHHCRMPACEADIARILVRRSPYRGLRQNRSRRLGCLLCLLVAYVATHTPLTSLHYQPPSHTTWPRLRAALNRPHNAQTSQTKHTQPITRFSWATRRALDHSRFGLDLAEWHHFGPGIFGPYHCGGHAVGGPNMAHIGYLCTTITVHYDGL